MTPSRSTLACALVAAATLAAPAAASAATATTRIVGGTPAANGAYSAQADVRQDLGLGLFSTCGGSLVSKNKVITAGHCVRTGGLLGGAGPVAGAEKFSVFIGSNVMGAGTRYAVAFVGAHPGFPAGGNNFPNDIAVLTLAGEPPVEPLPITDPSTDAGTYEPGARGTVIGWGLTSAGGSGSPNLLQVELPIVSDADCAKQYGGTLNPEVQICAGGEGGKDGCQGDSGGPLMTRADSVLKMTGVVSFGRAGQCGAAGVPSVYTDVTSPGVRDYITSVVGRSPTVSVVHASAKAGTAVTLRADAADPDGAGIASYAWDLDGNGSFEGPTTPTVKLSRATPGTQRVNVKVRDGSGMVGVGERDVVFARPRAKVSVSASRRRDGRVRISGRVTGGACAKGKVRVSAKPARGKTVARTVTLKSGCKYAVNLRVGRSARVTVRFNGTPGLKEKSVKKTRRV